MHVTPAPPRQEPIGSCLESLHNVSPDEKSCHKCQQESVICVHRICVLKHRHFVSAKMLYIRRTAMESCRTAVSKPPDAPRLLERKRPFSSAFSVCCSPPVKGGARAILRAKRAAPLTGAHEKNTEPYHRKCASTFRWTSPRGVVLIEFFYTV